MEVADRFYVKPLLRAMTFPQAAFVLALAAGSVRLIEVLAKARRSPSRPRAARRTRRPPRARRRSPTARRARGCRAPRARSSGCASTRARSTRRCAASSAGLELPLILAATEPLDSIYRAVNSYPHLVEPGIPGNPDSASDEELAAAAREVLDAVYASELAEVRARVRPAGRQGRASTDIADVARAATQGAVDTLLVDIDEKLPGSRRQTAAR